MTLLGLDFKDEADTLTFLYLSSHAENCETPEELVDLYRETLKRVRAQYTKTA